MRVLAPGPVRPTRTAAAGVRRLADDPVSARASRRWDGVGRTCAGHRRRGARHQRWEPDQASPRVWHPSSPGREGEIVRTVTDDGRETSGRRCRASSPSGPFDNHVVWDGASGEIRFGPAIRYPDGTTRRRGAAPPAGAEVSVTGYRTGGGATGNVGAGTVVVLRSEVTGVVSVSNSTPGFGGVDGETIDNLLRRGPLALRTGQQAVTSEDYERLAAEAEPSIARVCCLPPVESGTIRLLAVPCIRTASPATATSTRSHFRTTRSPGCARRWTSAASSAPPSRSEPPLLRVSVVALGRSARATGGSGA